MKIIQSNFGTIRVIDSVVPDSRTKTRGIYGKYAAQIASGGRVKYQGAGLVDHGPAGVRQGYAEVEVGAKKLVEPMSKEMKAWLKKEKIETDWVDLNRADRAKLKKRFANRNNPYFKGLEQKKIFEDHIEGLIKKGETDAWDKSIEDLVKDSKAKIEKSAAQDIITDKKFAVKGTSMTKLYPKLEARAI